MRLGTALAATCLLALAASAGAGSAAPSVGATARAWAIRIVVPGRSAEGTSMVSAPAGASAASRAGYAYPADGSIVRARSAAARVSVTTGARAAATASSRLTSLSLFRGEVRASSVTGGTEALASPAAASGGARAARITGLVVLGRRVAAAANREVPLGRWGYAIALEQTGARTERPGPGYHGFVAALDVFLTARHGGLPAGSELQIGYAEANAQAARGDPLPLAPSDPPEPVETGLPPVLSKPPAVTPRLGETGYVFPVSGTASFVDTFGAFRADVSGGWHHGDDIFAPLGTPVLAVAHGRVFSVGWNRVGGWRLWLQDDHGNEFYYAHLSAYSPVAVDGEIVNAGDVLGFVGDTGDAEGTAFHLHFEVHPLGLLGRGYDGAVDPTSYLDGWRHLVQVRLEAAAGTAFGPAPKHVRKAGAILLESSDISSASGLSPQSLRRALAPPVKGAGGRLLPRSQPPAALPVVGSPTG
ncbi:MAG TPA: M23 family metallopeptidase [Gaiellaceae bacterium]